MSIPTKSNTVIVFSESFYGRDSLRGLINELGLSAVCFEKEAICFDNMRPLSPKIVIVQTDSYQVAWRFVFAFYALKLYCPLLIVSEFIRTNAFFESGVILPIFVFSMRDRDNRLIRFITEMVNTNSCSTHKKRFPLFLGESQAIQQVRSMLPSLADSRDALLVSGEKGCGKEHLIRLIVQSSKTENFFIKVNCSELSADILSNGWLEKILSTEARNTPVTLFLHGIEMLSHQMQAEILLALEALDNWKNNDSSDFLWDVRFLSTSEISIESMLEDGRFRKDLFYRLNVIPIHLPPLRTRKEDIALLMDYFVIKAATQNGKCIMVPTQKARDTLYLYDWPGNVEELKSYMKRVSIAGNEICIFANKNMPRAIKNSKDQFLKAASLENLPKPQEIISFLPKAGELSLKGICEEFVSRTEKKLMQKALESTNWNRKKAAQLLNISYKSLLNKIKVYDII